MTDTVKVAPTVPRGPANKTWKRESAFLLLGVLCYEIIIGNLAMVSLVHLPILGYASGMFGLDVYTKLREATRITPPE